MMAGLELSVGESCLTLKVDYNGSGGRRYMARHYLMGITQYGQARKYSISSSSSVSTLEPSVLVRGKRLLVVLR